MIVAIAGSRTVLQLPVTHEGASVRGPEKAEGLAV